MASRSAIAARLQVARESLQEKLVRLAEREGVELPAPSPFPYRQPELKAAAELERLGVLVGVILGDKPAEPVPEVVEEVSEVEPDGESEDDQSSEGEPEEPTFHGYPLSEFAGKSDDEILAYKGIGDAMLAKIRAAQESA